MRLLAVTPAFDHILVVTMPESRNMNKSPTALIILPYKNCFIIVKFCIIQKRNYHYMYVCVHVFMYVHICITFRSTLHRSNLTRTIRTITYWRTEPHHVKLNMLIYFLFQPCVYFHKLFYWERLNSECKGRLLFQFQ